jgi:hypothetical protein
MDKEDNSRNCGKESVNDLSSSNILNKFCTVSGFKKMTKFLDSLGYRVGLSYTIVPYDWRISMKNSKTDNLIKTQIEHLNNFTSKKVSILAHSYGNLRTLHALNSFE